jgi:hypothetical protein
MRRVFISIALLLISSAAYAQVTNNVLQRVLLFASGNKAGTAFTVEVDGHQYVITARHNLQKNDRDVEIRLFLDGKWKPFKAHAIYPKSDSVDIVALDVRQKVTIDFPVEATSGDILIGQQVYFIGYPKPSGAFLCSYGGQSSNVCEIAFVKAGILSAFDFRDKDSVILYIDGQNNPGFSGGPIVFRHLASGNYRIAGVVKGYSIEAIPVLKEKDLNDFNAKAQDDLYIRGNSGIVVGYKINHIIDAIRIDTEHQKKISAN